MCVQIYGTLKAFFFTDVPQQLELNKHFMCCSTVIDKKTKLPVANLFSEIRVIQTDKLASVPSPKDQS